METDDAAWEWRPDDRLDVGVLASYEQSAIELVDVSMPLVPGLLQIREVAKAVLFAAGIKGEDAESMWDARRRRQKLLGTVDYIAYVGEAALHTPWGGPNVLRAQLEHLAGARDRGIALRIVPERQTKVPILHTWMWMRFSNASPMVYVEMISGAQILHERNSEPYTRTLEQLDQLALSVAASRQLIVELLKGHG